MKKKKRSVYEYTREDASSADGITREFALAYPDEIDDALERCKKMLRHPYNQEPGLTVLEFVLRMFEEEARPILEKEGYSTDLSELCYLEEKNTYPVRFPWGGGGLKLDVSIEALSAKKVLFAAQNVRESVAKGDAEPSAIDMLKLIFAAISADIYTTIMTRIRAKQGQKKGGKAPKQKLGIVLAIKHIQKTKGHDLSGRQIWQYFRKKHNQTEGQEALIVDNYAIYY